MLIWKIKCLKCGNEELWKAGKPKGKQQYKCKTCKKKFLTELNYSNESKQMAIAIFYEGNSGRAVGRMIGINKLTVCKWIKKLDRKSKSWNCKKKRALMKLNQ